MSRTGSHAPAVAATANASDGALPLPFELQPGMDARVAAARGDKHAFTPWPPTWGHGQGYSPCPRSTGRDGRASTWIVRTPTSQDGHPPDEHLNEASCGPGRCRPSERGPDFGNRA